MPDPAPPGVHPLYLRNVTCEKFGLKTGESISDLVPFKFVKKDDIMKEIQLAGKMSDFEPAKAHIESFLGPEILIRIDMTSQYGEQFLICYTEESQKQIFDELQAIQEAIEAQREAEIEAKRLAEEAENARKNAIFEDKPIISRVWSSRTSTDTDYEIRGLTHFPSRELVTIEVVRPKKFLKQPVNFNDKNADLFGTVEFKADRKDQQNFKPVRESEIGLQASPLSISRPSQTTTTRVPRSVVGSGTASGDDGLGWNRQVNKGVQYESAETLQQAFEGEAKDGLLSFLERATIKIEAALQQTETLDIYHETFRMGEEEGGEGNQAENELREIKNFADPTYSKSKTLACIDWMPRTPGVLAVSAVRNISFDQRTFLSGQTSSSHILVWDFRQLVKPICLLQCQYEILTFKFNRNNPNIVAGGTVTGQVVLWNISDVLAAAMKKYKRSSGFGGSAGASSASSSHHDSSVPEDEMDITTIPVSPIFVSGVDYSHKKGVSDLIWLPPNCQINYRGQLVSQEHLDGQCHQFISISGDGLVLVWDTRFEKIALDELKFIGKAKHVPVEKSGSGNNNSHLIWSPIFKAHLKKMEGVGELSLNRISGSGCLPPSVAEKSSLGGDYRSHLMLSTEEGDIIFADICSRGKSVMEGGGRERDEEEEEVETGRDHVKWISSDLTRPAVSLHQSPFFPDILLTVGDWGFHLWKVGNDRPLFVSPTSSVYLTGGAWSPTRPAVVIVAGKDGALYAWDFTDSSFQPSIELQATNEAISSLEFLSPFTLSGSWASSSASSAAAAGKKGLGGLGSLAASNKDTSKAQTKQQLLAVGDVTGTLHVYEMPRILVRKVHNEEALMSAFLDRELERIKYYKELVASIAASAALTEDSDSFPEPEPALPTPAPAVTLPSSPTKASQSSATTASASLAQSEPSSQENEALKKEEDEFAKLELAFLTDLGFNPEELGKGMSLPLPPPPRK